MSIGVSLSAGLAKRICIIACTASQYDGRERELYSDLVYVCVCDRALGSAINKGNDRELGNECFRVCSRPARVHMPITPRM